MKKTAPPFSVNIADCSVPFMPSAFSDPVHAILLLKMSSILSYVLLAVIVVAQGVQGAQKNRCDSLVLKPNNTAFIGSPVEYDLLLTLF